MARLANVCNRYPILEIQYQTERGSEADPIGTYNLDEPIQLLVTLLRDEVDEDGDGVDEEVLQVFNRPVYAQYYPEKKNEEWWVVVGHAKSGKLLAIKKITDFKAQASIQAELRFQISESELVASSSDSDG